MTTTEPQSAVRGFFGAALIAIGLLMAFLCGGCGALFLIGFLISGMASSSHGDISMMIMPVVLGGVPAAVGLLLFWIGKKLRKPPSPAESAEYPGER